MAVAHSMVVAAWHMLSTGEAYRELGGDYYLRRDDPERQARRLTRQLEQLGFNVSIIPAAWWGAAARGHSTPADMSG